MQLNRRAFTAGTVVAASTIPAVGTMAQSTPEATPVDRELESRLMAVLERYGVPGAVIALKSPTLADPVYMELGVANLKTGEAVSANMHFRIASVTKTFVATVVLQLVDEGSLSLDDTIATILPDLGMVNADIITVRHLLSMRSGLPQLADSAGYMSIIMGDPNQQITIDQIFGLATGMPARAEPDSEFDYNNLNYDILGEMILAATGITWHENVQARISEPLGLRNTLMTTSPDLPAPSPRGYGYLEQEIPAMEAPATPMATPVIDASTPDISATPVNQAGAYDLTAFNPTVAGAAGGLISTIKDQLVWAEALAAGALISPELHAEQVNGLPMDESGTLSYGLGVINLSGFIAHNGAIYGFQSAVGSFPMFGVSVAVLTNAHPTIGWGDAAFELASVLLG